MSTPMPVQLSPEQEHHLVWNDRLQDWLDGESDAVFEAHLSGCSLCQARLAEMEELDEALSSAAPRLALDSSFDERLFAQIDSIDESQRVAARQRLEQELQENLRALSRGWRRTLAFVVPGIIAGVALAFTLITWLDDSGLVRTLAVQNAEALGGTPDTFRLGLTALLGAGIGLAVSRWLATVTD